MKQKDNPGNNFHMEPLSNELVFQVLYKLPVPDILILCSLSTKLIQFSREDLTLWKNLVLRDFHQSHKEEETWRKEYLRLSEINANRILLEGVRTDNFNLINYALYHEPNNYNEAFEIAAELGDQELVDYFLKLIEESFSQPDYNRALIGAAKNGFHNIIRKLVEHCGSSLPDIGLILSTGAEYGHYNVVTCLPQIISQHYNQTMIGAAKGGHLEIVLRLLDNMKYYRVNTRYIDALYAALKAGKYNTSLFFLEKVIELNLIDDYSILLPKAVKGGNLELYERCLNLLDQYRMSQVNFNELLHISTEYGHYELCKTLLSELNPRDIIPACNGLIQKAITSGNVNILKMILNKIDDYSDMYQIRNYTLLLANVTEAIKSQNLEMVQFVLSEIERRSRDFLSDSGSLYQTLMFFAAGCENPEIIRTLWKFIRNNSVTPDYDALLNLKHSNSQFNKLLSEEMIREKVYSKNLILLLVKEGYDEIIKESIDEKKIILDQDDLTLILLIATGIGRSGIFDYLLPQLNDPPYQAILIDGIKSGVLKIVKTTLTLMKEKGIEPDYYRAAKVAMRNRKIRIVTYLFESMRRDNLLTKFLTEHIYLIYLAIKGGSLRIVKFILKVKEDKVSPNYNTYFAKAAYYGWGGILRFFHQEMLKNNITIYYGPAEQQAKNGGFNTVSRMLSKGDESENYRCF